jgi:pimeloyl-ACP methyl ester carboxylesterase
MTNHTFTLSDGRMLGFAIYGPENGQPVLYFHGTPSSRLEPCITGIYGQPIEPLLQEQQLQLIAIDRPGMGLSTFHPERTLQSVAVDVMELMAGLHLPACAVLCWSGGGPYALALAHFFPQQVKAVYIITGFSRSFGEPDVYAKMGWNKLYFTSAQKTPLMLQGTLSLLQHTTIKTPISQSLYELSNPDYALLKNVDAFNAFLDLTVKEAVHSSADGAVQEAALYFKPFPFALETLQTPVHFWWGTDDTVVTYVHAKHLETALPHVTPHYKAGEGHVSIYVHCIKEILETISTH